MLSDETRATPRPQPPAKVRARKSSQPQPKVSPRGKASSGSPPPPYYNPSDSVLGSPLPATSQLLGANNGGNSGDGPGPEAWLLERSREELSGLLTKAEGIIKTREDRTFLMPPPPSPLRVRSLSPLFHRNDRRSLTSLGYMQVSDSLPNWSKLYTTTIRY